MRFLYCNSRTIYGHLGLKFFYLCSCHWSSCLPHTYSHHGVSDEPNTRSAKEVLLELASEIDTTRRCRFNINRSAVLDGALRGFTRKSYNPKYQMYIKFSDDLGLHEEAVDLGGPRREFLHLLMKAIAQSQMFEGRDGKLNLALDSSGKL